MFFKCNIQSIQLGRILAYAYLMYVVIWLLTRADSKSNMVRLRETVISIMIYVVYDTFLLWYTLDSFNAYHLSSGEM